MYPNISLLPTLWCFIPTSESPVIASIQINLRPEGLVLFFSWKWWRIEFLPLPLRMLPKLHSQHLRGMTCIKKATWTDKAVSNKLCLMVIKLFNGINFATHAWSRKEPHSMLKLLLLSDFTLLGQCGSSNPLASWIWP